MAEYIKKRGQFYWWENVLTNLVKPLVLLLMKTPITPNMVTIFNFIVITPLTFYSASKGQYILTAIFIQAVIYFDVVDGNLARNKNMCSKLGHRLDYVSDMFFYICFYAYLGYKVGVSIPVIVLFIAVQQVYGFVATYYIVPRIRKIGDMKRFKIKQFFWDRGIMFGMDVTLLDFLATVMLLIGLRVTFYYVVIVLWCVDLIYRIVELKYNMRIKGIEE